MLSSENKINSFVSLNIIDKFFLSIVIITPFFLPFSRFLTDFFLSLSALFLIIIAINKNNYEVFFKKYTAIFFIWYLYLLLVSFLADNIFLSLQSTLFYFRYFLYALGIIFCLQNYKNFTNYYLLSIGSSTLILLLDSYIQLFFGYNIMGYIYDNAWNRLSSFFKEDYVLGSYLSRIIPFIIGLFLLSKIKLKYNILIILSLLIFSFIIILYSGDRSGLLYFIIFISIYLLLLNIKFFYKFLIFILFILVFIMIVINIGSIYKRMIDYTKNQIFNDSNFYPFSIQHQLIFETSIKIINNNYMLGIGPKNFREICKNYKTFSKYDLSEDGCSTHPHNTYLQLFSETGILGFIFIFIIFLLISYYIIHKIYLVNILKNFNNNLGNDLIIVSLFISLWPFVPTGSFFNNWLSIIYYLPIGFIIYNYIHNKND